MEWTIETTGSQLVSNKSTQVCDQVCEQVFEFRLDNTGLWAFKMAFYQFYVLVYLQEIDHSVTTTQITDPERSYWSYPTAS